MRQAFLYDPKALLYVSVILLDVPKILLCVPAFIIPERPISVINLTFSSSDQVTGVDTELYRKGPAEMRYVPESGFVCCLSNSDLFPG